MLPCPRRPLPYLLAIAALLAGSQACSPAAPAESDGDVADETIGESHEGVTRPLPIGTVLETTANLNFRTGPSTGTRVIRVLPKGTRVETVDQTNPENAYYRIQAGGEKGWSHGGYMRVVGQAEPWVYISSPQENAHVRNPVTIHFEAGGGVTEVAFESDGEPLHGGTLPADAGTFSYSFSNLGVDHHLLLTGVDDEGEEVATFQVFFTPVEAPAYVFPINLNRPGLTLSHFTSSSSSASFGAGRDGGRIHAGCDLYWTNDDGYDYRSGYHSLNDNLAIYAVADGTIIDYSPFYMGTNELVVDHGEFVIRYGEVDDGGLPNGLGVGSDVSAGQKIAEMGDLQMSSGSWSMLHFEIYSGERSGSLTNTSNGSYLHVPNANYQRRADLLDCRDFLTDIMP